MVKSCCFIFYLFVSFGITIGYSQDLPSKTLDSIFVSVSTYQFYNDVLEINKNNTYIPGSLSDVLQQQGNVHIKSYGNGNLATISVRGSSAQQTKITWDGLDITNPMLGQTDLSTINALYFDKITLYQGNNGAISYNGTQAGTIELSNSELNKNSNNELIVSQSYGSFSTFNNSLSLKVKQKKYLGKIVLTNSNSVNNYSYKYENETLKRKNAQYNTYGLLSENSFNINENVLATASTWYNKTERGIPTPQGLINQNESLTNDFLRNKLKIQYSKKNTNIQLLSGYFVESLNYSNPTFEMQSYSNFKRFIQVLSYTNNLTKNISFNAGLQVDKTNSVNSGYSKARQQIISSIFLNTKFQTNKNTLQGSIKLNKFNQKIEYSYHFNHSYFILKNLIFNNKVAKNIRFPTLNDLYYEPFSNKNLKTESGYSFESNIQFINKFLETKASVFVTNYTNWISWQPNSYGIFQPENLQVFTKGYEFLLRLNYVKGINTFSFSSDYSNVFTANKKLNKQLIYVPKYIFRNNLIVKNKTNEFIINQTFTGSQFIYSDNSESLESFQLTNISFNKSFQIEQSKNDLVIGIAINNIFNTHYQMIYNQPLPGKWYTIHVTIKFK